jgi:hypothetical protein
MSTTTEWGPPLWKFIHTICNFDFADNKPYVIRTIENLKALSGAIPCYKCRLLYDEKLKQLDTIDPSESLVLYKWSIELHNEVNKKLNKPIFIE